MLWAQSAAKGHIRDGMKRDNMKVVFSLFGLYCLISDFTLLLHTRVRANTQCYSDFGTYIGEINDMFLDLAMG